MTRFVNSLHSHTKYHNVLGYSGHATSSLLEAFGQTGPAIAVAVIASIYLVIVLVIAE
jgi:hypothetical protein